MSNFWDNLSGIFFKRKLLFRGNSCYSAHTLRNVGLRGNGKGWQHKLGKPYSLPKRKPDNDG